MPLHSLPKLLALTTFGTAVLAAAPGVALRPAAEIAVQDPEKKDDEKGAETRALEEFKARMATRKEAKPRDGWFVSARYGFELRGPKKWTQIAAKPDESWLATKYQSDKEYFYTDKDLGYTTTHRPEMLVIVFPKEAMKKAQREVDERETEQGTKVVTITFNNPYKSYQDFLDRTYSGGGFFLAEEEKTEVGGIPVIQQVYNVDKLSREGPKRIISWLYQDEDVEYALQTEVLADDWAKLKPTIENTYKSFAFVRRLSRLLHSGATQDQLVISFRDLNSGEPKERRTKRMDSEKALQERAIAKLPADWKHEKKGKVVVLSNADDKWTQRVLTHANEFMDWLEDNFGYIGPGEYVRTPIIRICKTSEEEASYRRGVDSGGGWGWSGADSEIVTSQDDSGWIGSEIDWLNAELFNYWMREKNADLMISMPEWLDNGLRSAVRGARMDGGKAEFRKDIYALESFREAERGGSLTDPKELFMMTAQDFYTSGGGSGFFNRTTECQLMAAFLISDDSRRVRQAKGLIEDYIKNLIKVIDEAEEEYAADLRKKLEEADDDEEEKKAVTALREQMRKREKTILERTFERTFGGWKDKDWEALGKGMRNSF